MLLTRNRINAIWWESNNWGDALNPVLIRHLSGRTAFRMWEYAINLKNEPIYTVIGSILDWPIFNNREILKNTVIWGTGFMKESGRLSNKPRKICAVRGPLTRDNLLKSGVECPEVYGDPALLYPMFYKPDIQKRYRLGIIAHHFDKESRILQNFSDDPEIRIIDIEGPITGVVDQICSCHSVASSSLHGIIAADAYNIPSQYIKLSESVGGKGFKFRDYFASVGRTETEPLTVTEKTTVDDILGGFSHYRADLDLNELLEACPFYHQS